MIDHGQNPQAACDAPRWRFNAGLEINAGATMPAATLQGLLDRGHRVDVIEDSHQDFGARRFIPRMGDPATEGYVDPPDARRSGQPDRTEGRFGVWQAISPDRLSKAARALRPRARSPLGFQA